MNIGEKLNMTMLCDFYELTMGNGYFENGFKDKITYFDVFFRRVPDKGGFAIAAGLEQLIRYIEDLHFTPEDIAYLRGRNLFCEEFLEYLANFRFTGDIYAVPEGTPVFPKEPLVVVRAPAIEAQLIETFTLLTAFSCFIRHDLRCRVCHCKYNRIICHCAYHLCCYNIRCRYTDKNISALHGCLKVPMQLFFICFFCDFLLCRIHPFLTRRQDSLTVNHDYITDSKFQKKFADGDTC